MLRRKILTALGAAAFAPLLTVVLPMATANAHGYISSPASRQAQCAQGLLECGDIKYEPQSVEGPKGQLNCSAGDPRWADLDDDSKPWQVYNVGTTVSFSWTFTARHATTDFEYWIGNTEVASFDGGGQEPDPDTTHTVNLSGFSGRQKLIGIWNIADTANAFYACVDLNIAK
ncbi:lytic polysaccharide monooxygenase auxiliary activity family 9 protein [Nocardia terpenica]|uniref:lytic polysaccharide monooxygenase auxiliary activity family 9 protein n=1 Tax=Nocardia terpenica TaxID=455432 RepID=UPI002B4B278A|nr:lytic polysaccharide monooxygenase auxiliary activity family 9 protein [Nocardia terpenica]